jgi:hypothetical protein
MIYKILLLILLISSCGSTLKEEDCSQRDWLEQGLSDASRGLEKSMYSTYLKVCSQIEKANTLEQYLKGYLQGAKRYCSFYQGKLVGESARPFPSVCEVAKFDEFSKGYIEGKKAKKKALK